MLIQFIFRLIIFVYIFELSNFFFLENVNGFIGLDLISYILIILR
ncbi:hypothetical protein ACR2Y9_26875, partial [Klebsiella pneumoniae]